VSGEKPKASHAHHILVSIRVSWADSEIGARPFRGTTISHSATGCSCSLTAPSAFRGILSTFLWKKGLSWVALSAPLKGAFAGHAHRGKHSIFVETQRRLAWPMQAISAAVSGTDAFRSSVVSGFRTKECPNMTRCLEKSDQRSVRLSRCALGVTTFADLLTSDH
jgi:hypothetical protein